MTVTMTMMLPSPFPTTFDEQPGTQASTHDLSPRSATTCSCTCVLPGRSSKQYTDLAEISTPNPCSPRLQVGHCCDSCGQSAAWAETGWGSACAGVSEKVGIPLCEVFLPVLLKGGVLLQGWITLLSPIIKTLCLVYSTTLGLSKPGPRTTCTAPAIWCVAKPKLQIMANLQALSLAHHYCSTQACFVLFWDLQIWVTAFELPATAV